MIYRIFFAMLILALPATTMAAGPVLINEIAWMGSTNSANHEWIELYNTSDSDIDLTDWQLIALDGAPIISLSGIITGKSYYLLERTSDDTVPSVNADLIYTGALGNTGENIKLLDNNDNVVDEVISADQWSAGDNATKQTMERTSENSWETSLEPNGTPRQINSTATAEEDNEPEEENNNNEETEDTEEDDPATNEDQDENTLSRCEKKVNRIEQRLNKQLPDIICQRIEQRQQKIRERLNTIIERIKSRLSHRISR